MSGSYAGVRALVTGAGSGIGQVIASALAGAGADVAIHYGRSADGARKAVEEILSAGGRAAAFQADVRRSDEVEQMVNAAAGFLGGLDILVCNAGHMVGRVPIAETDDAHYEEVISVNLGATFRTCRAALPVLRGSSRGRVITMASLAAQNGGGPGAALYAAAKAAVVGFSKGLAKELGPDGITVNVLAPGYISGTAFHDTFSTDDSKRAMVSASPLGIAGEPADVAEAVLYLASERARFITGTTLDINGGTYLR